MVVILWGAGGRTPLVSTLETEWAWQARNGLVPACLVAMWQGGPPAPGGPPGTHSHMSGRPQGTRQLLRSFSGSGSGNRCGKCCNVLSDESDGVAAPSCCPLGAGGRFWEPAGSPRPPDVLEKGVPGGWSRVGRAGPGGCPLPPPCCGLPCEGPGAGAHLPLSLWSPHLPMTPSLRCWMAGRPAGDG